MPASATTNDARSKASSRQSQSVTASLSPGNVAAYQSTLLKLKESKGSKAVWRARIVFLLCLSAVAVVLGVTAFYFIRRAEQDLAETMFESIADRALSEAVVIARQKRWSTITMSSLVSEMYPNASQFPFVTIPGFERMVNNLLSTSSNFNMGFAPFVYPHNQQEWEDFMYDYYHVHRNPPFPDNMFVSEFGRGIWGKNPLLNNTDHRYYDDGLTTTYNSTQQILVPMADTNKNFENILLFNLHTEPGRGIAIDDMIECVEQRNQAVPPENHTDLDCGVITKMVTFVKENTAGPSSLIYTPIFPANDPDTLVGMITTPMLWDQILANAFADEVSGVDCVLETHEQVFSYTVVEGVLKTVGIGDTHQTKYDKFRRSIKVTDTDFYTEKSPVYTLSLYPSDKLYDVYSTQNPTTVMIGAILIIVFMSLLFFVYDYSVRKEFLAKRELLAAKRSFIRFVSHEVRTPLNAVCMGLALIQTEMAQALGFNSPDDMAAMAVLNEDKEGPPDKRTVEEMKPLFDTTAKLAETKTESNTISCNHETGAISKASSSSSTSRASKQPVSTQTVIEWFRLSQDVLRNTINAVDVLSDVLNYDKIESGSLTLELAKIPIWQILEDTVRDFRLSAQRKNIDFELAFSTMNDSFSSHGTDPLEDVPQEDEEAPSEMQLAAIHSLKLMDQDFKDNKVIGDKVRIIQVIRNVISNAIKFTPEGGSVQISATWHPLEPEAMKKTRKVHLASAEVIDMKRSGDMTMAVTDTGAGLSASQLECLFRAGIQFNASELQQGKGSGFGLYIAKGIVEMHEGKLVASSDGLGKGTTFTMTLPLYHSPDPVQPSQPSTSPASSPASASPNDEIVPLRVLVVDDAVSNRKLLGRLLQNRGHICELADDGDIAVQIESAKRLEGQPIDCVLLDYEMPRLNGPAAAKEMRDGGCDAFIVGVTGNMLPEDVQYFISCGANAVLPKPLNVADLENLWLEHGVLNSKA